MRKAPWPQPIGEERAVIARDHCFPTIRCPCRAGLVRGSVFNVEGRAADGLTHQTNDPTSIEFWCSMKERPPWVAKPFPVQTQQPCPWKVLPSPNHNDRFPPATRGVV